MMNTANTEQVTTKKIAYWSDGYFISDDDAIEQAELLDSVDAFGGEHGVLEVPVVADHEEVIALVSLALEKAA